MLNISKNPLYKEVQIDHYTSLQKVGDKQYYRQLNKFLLAFGIILLVILFLPWTQNITGYGKVTTLMPGQRPQNIQSQIPGRVEQWFIREGDYVKAGDTILRISEVKSDYFDSKLSERTNLQLQAKNESSKAYLNKIEALDNQLKALEEELNLKLQQASNKILQSHLKVKSDSIELEAALTNQSIAQKQYDRVVALNLEGLKATRDVEDKKLKLQMAQAKYIAQQNKLLESQNNVLNAELELSRIKASYGDKLSKVKSDLYSAKSLELNNRVEVSKLENSFENYSRRGDLLWVRAPQDGYVNKIYKAGIGESFKEGENLLTITPAQFDLAVETYVRPIDMPLIHLGERVRVQFDGWPAIVFNGWESVSYGTYGAIVVALENDISPNGKYRVMLSPDPEDHPWPKELRVGSGAMTIALLNDVPIWYEIWRQVNGFPPDFYKPQTSNKESK
ncbi:MAG: HlyD family efflux transporter periplasmic adaptor subunit [Flavobacteriaceae bacterium]|jgi:adhesin transport system membrane fusion protein|nr:HlyD family efflux transporter periplasmic adaptor subunit [Flavobacteriaceae bacterium]NVJ73187.1 HlyD family efflux transporter periplasmic adaptor subunit [Flavobacteriaceae bacterium]